MTNRKYRNGERVITDSLGLNLIVIDAILCLGGWRYELGFPTKKGAIDKRAHHRFFFEDTIHAPNKTTSPSRNNQL